MIRSSFLCLDDNFVEAFLSSFPTGLGINEEIRRSLRKCTILGELFKGFDMNRPLSGMEQAGKLGRHFVA